VYLSCQEEASRAADGLAGLPDEAVWLIAPAARAAARPVGSSVTKGGARLPSLAGFGEIDSKGAIAELSAVEHADGLLSLCLSLHFDEAKAPRSARVPVGDEGYGFDRPGLGEEGVKVTFYG